MGLLGKGFGILGKGFNMLGITDLLGGDSAKRENKKKMVIQGQLGEDLSKVEGFVKQTQTLKKILVRQVNATEHQEVEFMVKAEICDVLSYFLDYKQDQQLNKLKSLFKRIVEDDKLISRIQQRSSGNVHEQIKRIFEDWIKLNIKQILPQVLPTGTSIDDEEPNLQRDKVSEQLDLDQILGYDIFPTLINLFQFSQRVEMEQQILLIITRLYNQRQEFAKLTRRLLILFDEENIKILKIVKKKFKIFAKNVDESESWIDQLHEEKSMKTLEDTTLQIKFFSDVLIKGSTLNNNDNSVTQDPMMAGSKHPKIDPIRQEIIANNQIYLYAINLIKDAIFVLDDLDQVRHRPDPRARDSDSDYPRATPSHI